MAIRLQKGQTIDLRKNSHDLSQVTIGLGWDMAAPAKGGGLLGKLFGGAPSEVDLDAMAFLLDDHDKIRDRGNQNLIGGDVIFFNHRRHRTGNIWLTGDNRTGSGEGDDEQIVVLLDLLSPSYAKIVFVVAIYEGHQRKQHFGQLDNAYIRAVDAQGIEMMRFDLNREACFDHQCSLLFAELYRHQGTWKFRAVGEPHTADSFVPLLNHYL
jgi:tellurium resistance protein TerD